MSCFAATSALIGYSAAAGGMSWKKPVSNTATCGTSGSSLRASSMPTMFAGLCSGASGIRSRIISTIWSSISCGFENSLPPWTTRWPTAAISTECGPQPLSSMSLKALSRPSA